MKFIQKLAKSEALQKQRRYRFVLLSSLLIIPSSTWGMDPAPEDERTQISQLRRAIEDVNRLIPSERENGIAILGSTKVGKSTLFNYLLDVPLYGAEDPKSFGFIIRPEGEGLSKTTSGFVSETTFPIIKDDYYDFAGFQATSGPVQDIINAYSIYKLLNNTKNIKILLVTSEEQLKGTDFIPAIRQLEGIFRSQDIREGLCLVITHRREITSLEHFRSVFAARCRDVENLTESQKRITDFLSNRENSKVAFFNKPIQPGPISDENKNDINTALNNTKYISGLKPQISLLDPSKYLIQILAAEFVKDTMSHIIKSFNENLYQNCAILIEKTLKNTQKTAAEFRIAFKGFSTSLKEISTNTEDFDDKAEKFQTILKDLSPNLKVEFSNLLEALKFFELVKPEYMQIKKNPSWGKLFPAHTYLETLSAEPQEIISDSLFTLKGSIVSMHDLIERKDKQQKNFGELNVYCKHSLLLDQDVQAPGIKVALLAPYWFVVGIKEVSLKGADGLDHEQETANSGKSDGEAGVDGLPGLPGQSGGHFYGKGEVFYNLKALTINVNGGRGGKGQNGGNGAKGSDGYDGDRNGIENRLESYRISQTLLLPEDQACNTTNQQRAKDIFTLGNQKFREVYQSGMLGKAGGDAGKAGEGGYPGKKGSVFIEETQDYKTIPCCNTIDERGADGIPGKPGEGGKNGKIYKRTYIAEYSAPATRGILPSYNEEAKRAVGISTAEAVLTGGGTAAGAMMVGVAAGPATAAVGAAVVTGFAIKGISSVISSHASSYWEGEVMIEDHPQNASSGSQARESNKAAQSNANDSIDLEGKKRYFEQELGSIKSPTHTEG